MINSCDDCIHSKICMYKQIYQENYMTLKNELKYKAPFSVELECKEYESNRTTVTIKNFETGMIPSNSSGSNPCEGCSIYEDVKRGKTIISDACNFCSKSPLKISN